MLRPSSLSAASGTDWSPDLLASENGAFQVWTKEEVGLPVRVFEGCVVEDDSGRPADGVGQLSKRWEV